MAAGPDDTPPPGDDVPRAINKAQSRARSNAVGPGDPAPRAEHDRVWRVWDPHGVSPRSAAPDLAGWRIFMIRCGRSGRHAGAFPDQPHPIMEHDRCSTADPLLRRAVARQTRPDGQWPPGARAVGLPDNAQPAAGAGRRLGGLWDRRPVGGRVSRSAHSGAHEVPGNVRRRPHGRPSCREIGPTCGAVGPRSVHEGCRAADGHGGLVARARADRVREPDRARGSRDALARCRGPHDSARAEHLPPTPGIERRTIGGWVG